MDYFEILKLTEELKKYLELEGTEIGEACSSLVNLTHHLDYVSDEFEEALIKELKAQLNNFKTNYRIVECKKMVEHKYLDLEYLPDFE